VRWKGWAVTILVALVVGVLYVYGAFGQLGWIGR
jgi:hypothetical protein